SSPFQSGGLAADRPSPYPPLTVTPAPTVSRGALEISLWSLARRSIRRFTDLLSVGQRCWPDRGAPSANQEDRVAVGLGDEGFGRGVRVVVEVRARVRHPLDVHLQHRRGLFRPQLADRHNLRV